MAYNTTPYHGKASRVEKNDVAMSFTDGWQISASVDMADISSQGDSWKTGIPGLGSWNGSFSGHFVAGNTEQKAIFDNIVTATPGTKLTDMKFLLDGATNAFTGNIYVTSISVNPALGGKTGFTVNFQGDGALTLTDSA
jgi:predicted secreted protein